MLRCGEQGLADLLRRGVIRHADIQVHAAAALDGIVADARRGGVAVRDVDALAVDRGELRIRNADLLHGAAVAADLHKVADVERVRRQERHAADNVGKRVLHGKRNGKGDDTQDGNERRDVHAEGACRHEHEDGIEQGAHGRPQEREHRPLQPGTFEHAVKQLQQQLDEQKPDHDDEDDRDELLQRQRCKKFLDGSQIHGLRLRFRQGLLLGPPQALVGIDILHELVARDGLLLEQVQGDLVEQAAVFGQNFLGLIVAVVQELADLFVRSGGRRLGAVGVGLAVEVLVALRRQRHEADAVAHAVLHDHLACQIRRALDVVRRAGRLNAEHGLLRSAAAEHGAQLHKQLVAGVEVLLLLRHLHGVAQRAGRMRDDGDLGNGLRVLLQRGHERMADLVIGHDALFDVRQNGALLLGARDDDLERRQQVLLIHGLAAHAHGAQRRLVDEVGKVRADRAGRGLCDLLEVDVLGKADVARVDEQGLVAPLQIRAVNDDAAVKAARAQQGLIENFRAVRRRKDHDAL